MITQHKVLLLILITLWTTGFIRHLPARAADQPQSHKPYTQWTDTVAVAANSPITEEGKWPVKPRLAYAAAPRYAPTPHVQPKTPSAPQNTATGQINTSETKISVNTAVLTPSSLQDGFLWPTTWTYVIQPFRRGHRGIDITRDSAGGHGGGEDEEADQVSTDESPNAPKILAAKSGMVSFVGWMGGFGKLVIIDHEEGWQTYYAHLSTTSVKRGATVEKGQVLGIMGTTGRSTGVHLHFEIRKDGVPQNPLVAKPSLKPSSTPIVKKPEPSPTATPSSTPLPTLMLPVLEDQS